MAKINLGNCVKEIQDCVSIRANTSHVDPDFWYVNLYGQLPVYKCTVTIHTNNDDEDECDGVYSKIFNSLVDSGDFTPVIFEYGKDSKRKKKSLEYEYVERFFVASNTEPVTITFYYGDLCVSSYLGPNKIQEIIDKYLKQFDYDDDKVKCYVIVNDQDSGMYLSSFSIKLDNQLDFDLYNEGFEETHNDIVKSINDDSNGLYLLYGSPGTGKTTYIRNLIKECETEKRKFVYVPSNLFTEFTNPNILPFLMANRGCVFIIEDCESLVTTTDGIRSDAIANLLNMADGLLADALDIKIICTFNIDDGEIDEALLRPGRCRCRYEFNLLNKDRANNVAKKLGLNEVNEDVSLAQLFNNGVKFTEKKEHKKIGFQ